MSRELWQWKQAMIERSRKALLVRLETQRRREIERCYREWSDPLRGPDLQRALRHEGVLR